MGHADLVLLLLFEILTATTAPRGLEEPPSRFELRGQPAKESMAIFVYPKAKSLKDYSKLSGGAELATKIGKHATDDTPKQVIDWYMQELGLTERGVTAVDGEIHWESTRGEPFRSMKAVIHDYGYPETLATSPPVTVIAHELGHYLGLKHTLDEVSCGAALGPFAAENSNLMNPGGTSAETVELTTGQRERVRLIARQRRDLWRS